MMSTINWNKMTGEEFEKGIGEEYLEMLGIMKEPVLEQIAADDFKQVGEEWSDDVDVLYYSENDYVLADLAGEEENKENIEFGKVEALLNTVTKHSTCADENVSLWDIVVGKHFLFILPIAVAILLLDMGKGDWMFAKAHKDKIEIEEEKKSLR